MVPNPVADSTADPEMILDLVPAPKLHGKTNIRKSKEIHTILTLGSTTTNAAAILRKTDLGRGKI